MTQCTVFVCTACASVWKDGKREGKSGGEHLLESLSTLVKDWDLRDNFHIQEVECMSACSNSCAVSFAAPGKYTYLFGNLPSQGEESAIAFGSSVAIAILECASQYYHKSDGLLPWAQRPEPLKKGVIARIPPLS
jgi:predicted metal-binding protein